jgi:hypothetical protein
VNGPISGPLLPVRPRRRLLGLLAAAVASSCAHSPWPDEPGIPVEIVRFDNLNAGDAFFATLTDRRRAANREPPVTAPRYQSDIRAFADDLQAGKTSIRAAERAVEAWARAAYAREVKTFALDCSAGSAMPLPDLLVQTPVAVISYAAAHFHPRSLPKRQCAILGVVLVGSETIDTTKI